MAYFYSDGLNDSWSWGGTYNAVVTETVHSGANAIGVEYTGAYGALRLHPGAAFDTAGYDKLVFYAHPNGQAHALQVYIQEATKVPVNLTAGSEWVRVEVSLSDLGSPTTIADVQIQDNSGGAQPVFFVDDITLEGPGGAMAYIYTDSLLEDAGKWNGSYNFADATQVHSGAFALSVEVTGSWGGFHIARRQGPIYTAAYDRIAFYVHPTGSERILLIQTQNAAGGDSTQHSFTVPTGNDWTLVEIPLSALGSPANIRRITIQDGTGGTQSLFYIDDIMLLGN